MESPSGSDSLHIIYISHLAPSADYRAFAAVCRTARTRNPTLNVGGVLLFDGERFCQWLHGQAGAVEDLMASITRDDRHTDIQVLLHATLAHDLADSRWCCGFVLPDALDVLDRAGSGRNDAIGSFRELLATADLEPSVTLRGAPEPPAAQACLDGA
jgi:hypothetical protein